MKLTGKEMANLRRPFAAESEEAAWAGLWLYAATASSGVYDFDEYKTMLESAGFTNVVDINQGSNRALKL